ncbi:STY4534 family ICE replication protein [Erwinia amylovora]|uniref:STY4534 family ICE replication protein n=1 Tax=Erwinia amylovora TaxID=552 RepID=UPI0014442B7F|nr:STY4534 family ICE replication protein [Erwinia amylovora]
MTANANTTPASNGSASGSQKKEYFNLNVNGIGYLSSIRRVQGPDGEFTCAVINALTGPTDNASYTRFDVTIAGADTTKLINRCQKAVDEEEKVLLGFVLSGLKADVFTLQSGEHAGESRPSLKARFIKVDFIKKGQEVAYTAPNASNTPDQGSASQAEYDPNSF